MTHTFRTKKAENNNGNPTVRRYKTRQRDNGSKADQSSDLEQMPEIHYNNFDKLSTAEIAVACKEANISIQTLSRPEILEQLLKHANQEHGASYGKGILEITHDGWGFLRKPSYQPSLEDIYVSQSQVKRFGLRPGDQVFGLVRAPKEGEKYRGMLRVESVNGLGTASPELISRKDFDHLTPLFPDERIRMETLPDNIGARIIDLIAPIGKGQRALIVAPPKAGKTAIVKHIANAITLNYPDIYLMMLLVDERPEEVTDMRRFVKGQVISSTFDEPAENHMRVTDLCLEQAKRLVETVFRFC